MLWCAIAEVSCFSYCMCASGCLHVCQCFVVTYVKDSSKPQGSDMNPAYFGVPILFFWSFFIPTAILKVHIWVFYYLFFSLHLLVKYIYTGSVAGVALYSAHCRPRSSVYCVLLCHLLLTNGTSPLGNLSVYLNQNRSPIIQFMQWLSNSSLIIQLVSLCNVLWKLNLMASYNHYFV